MIFPWQKNLADSILSKDVLICHDNVRDVYPYEGPSGDVQLCGLADLISLLLSDNFPLIHRFDPFDRLQAARVQAERVTLEPRRGLVPGLKDAPPGEELSLAFDAEGDLGRLMQAMSAPLSEDPEAPEQIRCLVLAHPDVWLPTDTGGDEICAKRTVMMRRLVERVAPGRKLILIYLTEGRIPQTLYLRNPHVALMGIPLPEPAERRAVCRVARDGGLRESLISSYVEQTEGLSSWETARILDQTPGFLRLETLAAVSAPNQIEKSVQRFKFGERPDYYERLSLARLRRAEDFFIQGKVVNDSGQEVDRVSGVLGQDEAVRSTIKMLWRAKANVGRLLREPGSLPPRGVLFYCGPSGTGKTMLAKLVARFLFGTEEAFSRFDMSEYMQEISVNRLIGAPPGYVGSDKGGELTNAVRQKPFSVLLFDEIEKAHPRVLDIFLQILSDGRLTDSHGQTAFFSESIVIFTSNLGMRSQRTRQMQDIPGGDSGSPCKEREQYDAILLDAQQERVEGVHDLSRIEATMHQRVGDHFRRWVTDYYEREISRPELLNRLGNNIVPFQGVSGQEVIGRIFSGNIDKICRRFAALHEQRRLTLNISPEVLDYFIKRHGDNVIRFGGRAVINALEDELLTEIARRLIEIGNTPADRELRARVDQSGFIFVEG